MGLDRRRRCPAGSVAGTCEQVFNGRPLADGTDLLAIEMPGRAEDAAIVP
jgi:hypothetical protein